jgi:hypothetical protein
MSEPTHNLCMQSDKIPAARAIEQGHESLDWVAEVQLPSARVCSCLFTRKAKYPCFKEQIVG